MTQELNGLYERFESDCHTSGQLDAEAMEVAVRDEFLRVGRRWFETYLNKYASEEHRTIIERDGQKYYRQEKRPKQLRTILGTITVERYYFYDAESHRGCCPFDEEWDVEGTMFSVRLRRIIGRVGAYRSFELGEEDIREFTGLEVAAKEIERVSEMIGRAVNTYSQQQAAGSNEHAVPMMYVCMDGTGVPMVKQAVEGRTGKGADGIAKTREAKLGCVFTQSTVDAEGYAIRDEHSTSYVGAIETAEQFGKRIELEGTRRGSDRAQTLCGIGDGAPWIWNLMQDRFPRAIQIVDLYHAREHYWTVARLFFKQGSKKLYNWTERRKQELNAGKVKKVQRAIKRLRAHTSEQRQAQEQHIEYFEKNRYRMQYDYYRSMGYFVGSGVLEAGCRTLVGQRLKQSGMHWTVEGANAIIASRCLLFSHRWEDYWAARSAA